MITVVLLSLLLIFIQFLVNTTAWTLSSLLYNGVNLLPVWFFWEAGYSFAKSSGMDKNYINSYVYYYKTSGWILLIVIFTTVCGFAVSLAGKKYMIRNLWLPAVHTD